MQMDILILASGEIQINIDGDMDFAAASALTQAYLERLQALGVPITVTCAPEQHTADGASHAHLLQEGSTHVEQ